MHDNYLIHELSFLINCGFFVDIYMYQTYYAPPILFCTEVCYSYCVVFIAVFGWVEVCYVACFKEKARIWGSEEDCCTLINSLEQTK